MRRRRRRVSPELYQKRMANLVLSIGRWQVADLSGAEHELAYYVPRELKTWGGGVVRKGWS